MCALRGGVRYVCSRNQRFPGVAVKLAQKADGHDRNNVGVRAVPG